MSYIEPIRQRGPAEPASSPVSSNGARFTPESSTGNQSFAASPSQFAQNPAWYNAVQQQQQQQQQQGFDAYRPPPGATGFMQQGMPGYVDEQNRSDNTGIQMFQQPYNNGNNGMWQGQSPHGAGSPSPMPLNRGAQQPNSEMGQQQRQQSPVQQQGPAMRQQQQSPAQQDAFMQQQNPAMQRHSPIPQQQNGNMQQQQNPVMQQPNTFPQQQQNPMMQYPMMQNNPAFQQQNSSMPQSPAGGMQGMPFQNPQMFNPYMMYGMNMNPAMFMQQQQQPGQSPQQNASPISPMSPMGQMPFPPPPTNMNMGPMAWPQQYGQFPQFHQQMQMGSGLQAPMMGMANLTPQSHTPEPKAVTPEPRFAQPAPEYSASAFNAASPSSSSHGVAGFSTRDINEPLANLKLSDAPPPYQEPAFELDPFTQRLEGMTEPELNILILGETGVGKSTFINAFVNYVYFKDLDDALKRQEVQCVIPSRFTWQSLDKRTDDYIAKTINVKPNTGEFTSVESHADENANAGESATQETKHYKMQVGRTLLRLIDTPGIGDTRGSAKDKENMDGILKSLKTVDTLHGILILLKPNNARLTIMFTFCLKELLTHLHRDAAKNIVFGFTNARNTSFRPGETYTTLKKMIDEDQTVGIKLGREITYCFDSESFRCLAAYHQGVDITDMGGIEDYRLSWEKSAKEVFRMLEHFSPSKVEPHRVAETRDLYRTRELVRVLTVPMADITQVINANVALQKDEQRNLADALSKNEALDDVLYLNKVVYEVQTLAQPRTVCSDKSCGEFKDNQKVYKSMCHDPCYLENVAVDQFPCEELTNCYAFIQHGTNCCVVCGHSWQLHLHVLWETTEKTVQVQDEAVMLRISEGKDIVEVKEQALRSRDELIKKYESERETIQKAAGQFAVFLKNSSIKPWNDSKLAYLDQVIEQEKAKVEAGGSDKRLIDLKADRNQHQEEIRTLTEYMKAGETEKLLTQDGIRQLIDELYGLEMMGADLKKAAQKLEDIQNSTMTDKKGKGSGGHGHSGHAHGGGGGGGHRSSGYYGGGSGGGRYSAAGGSGGPSFASMLANGRKRMQSQQQQQGPSSSSSQGGGLGGLMKGFLQR